MAVEIGALRALLSLDSAAFERGAARAQASMNGLQRGLTRAADRVGAVGRRMSMRVTAPLAAAAAGMVGTASNAAFEIDRLSKLANASTTEFQRFAAGARTVGIEQEKLSDILKDVNDRVGDFIATGGGPMADFFENIAPKVGVTAEQFQRLSGPEALQLYVSSLEKAGVSQQQMTFYMEAMASDATALIPLLRNGGAEMQAMGDRAEELGAIMSDETIASLNAARGSIRQLMGAGTGLRNEFVAALAPTLERLASLAADLGEWFSDLDPKTKQFAAVTAALAAALGPLVIVLGTALAGLAALVSPIGLVVAGLAALAAGVVAVIANWDTLSAALVSALDTAWVAVQSALSDWVDQFTQFGRDLLDGLVSGILSRVGAVRDTVTDLAGNVAGWFADIVKIQSPSKVFDGFGRNIIEGLVNGITAIAGRAQVSMREVADGIKAPVETAMASMGGLASHFDGLISGGKGFADVLSGIASHLESQVWESVFSGGLFGGGGGGLFGGIGKLLGFEGGGFTGMGPRSGGVDGRGGFPAILHPNETVIDHTKPARGGGGGGGQVVVQVAPSPYFDVRVEQVSGLVAAEVVGANNEAMSERQRAASWG